MKFTEAPNLDKLRSELDKAGLKDPRIQPMLPASNHEVLISLPEKEMSEMSLDQGRDTIVKGLSTGQAQEGKTDLNNVGYSTLQQYLMTKDPLHAGAPNNTALPGAYAGPATTSACSTSRTWQVESPRTCRTDSLIISNP